MGFQDAVHHHQRQHHQDRNHVEVFHLIQLVAKENGLATLMPIGPSVKNVIFIDENLDDGAEGQCHHGQVGPGHPQGRQCQHSAKSGSDANGCGDCQEERHPSLKNSAPAV